MDHQQGRRKGAEEDEVLNHLAKHPNEIVKPLSQVFELVRPQPQADSGRDAVVPERPPHTPQSPPEASE